MIKRYKHFLLPILSGVLLALTHPPTFGGFWGGFIVWIALIPLLFFIYLPKISKKEAFLGGFTAGLIFLATAISWFLGAYPLDWVGIENNLLGLPVALLMWFLASSELALFVGLFTLALRHFFEKIRKNQLFITDFLLLFLIPSLWVIFEYARAWGFGLFWIGSESLLGPHWTFGNLAYTLSDNKYLLQTASVFGMYGLSFVIVLTNSAFFLTISGLQTKKSTKMFWPAALAIIIIGILTFTGRIIFNQPLDNADKQTKVALLQTKTPSTFQPTFVRQLEILTNQFKLFGEIDKKAPDVIIFPEDANFLNTLGIERTKEFFNGIFNNQPKLIIDSGQISSEDGKKFIATIYFDTKDGIIAADPKHFLMPLGEYLPYWFKTLAYLTGQKDWIKNFETKRGFTKGPENQIVRKFSALLCSGFLSPNLSRQAAKNGAGALIVSGSESVFRGPDALVAQKIAIAKFRAVENRRYYLQATNYDRAFIASPKGEIQKISKSLEPEILVDNIILISSQTWYNKLGDWILIVALTVIIASAAFLNSSKTRNLNKA